LLQNKGRLKSFNRVPFGTHNNHLQSCQLFLFLDVTNSVIVQYPSKEGLETVGFAVNK